MNKKIVLIVLPLLIVLAIAVFYLTRPAFMSMEQIFPSGPLGYLRISHVSGDVDQFIKSPFWSSISTMDVAKILEHNNVSSSDILHLKKMQKDFEMVLTNPFTKKFLGTEVAVGIYDKNVKGKDSIDSFDALFATRLGFSLQMAELFVSMGHQWGDDVSTTSEKYNGFNIVHAHFTKRKIDLQYTRLNDILLVSFSPSGILHQALDVYRKKQGALAAEEDFVKVKAHAYEQGHVIFYINIHKFYDMLKKHIPESQKATFDQLSESTVGFKSYSMSFLPGDISKLKLLINFEPAQLNPYWHNMFACPGYVNSSLKFVPHNVVAYSGGLCYDFKDLWGNINEGIQASADSENSLDKWKHRLEKRFKFNFQNDVLPVLGSQAGWYLNDVDVQGFFPYPRGVVFFKVENRTAAEELMKKFAMTPFGPLQQEDYQQSSMHYLPLPFGANMDPGYAFLGDYLLLGSSRQLLKTSIDAFKNSNQSLESNEVLKQFNVNASEKTQGVFFIKIEDVSSRLGQLLDWYNKTVSSKITAALAYQQEASSRRKELEESFLPKKEELSLAQKRFKALQMKVSTTPEEDKENEVANMEHLSSDIKTLQEDVDTFRQQEEELEQASLTYQAQAASAKLWLFNADEVLKPVLKSLETLHALGVKWYLMDRVSETEILIK